MPGRGGGRSRGAGTVRSAALPLRRRRGQHTVALARVFVFAYIGLQAVKSTDDGVTALNVLELATIDLERFAKRCPRMVGAPKVLPKRRAP